METVRTALAWIFAAGSVLIVFGVLVHVPYFMRLAKRHDPAEYAQAGGQIFFSSSYVLTICGYLLRGSCRHSRHAAVRRHGRVLRWTFAVPLVLCSVILVTMMVVETASRSG